MLLWFLWDDGALKALSGGANCAICVKRANLIFPLDDVALNTPGVGGDCLGTDLCLAAVPPPQSWSGTRCSGAPCCRSHRSCWPHAPAAPTTPLRTPSGSRTPVKAEPSWRWRCGTTPAGPCGCWRAANPFGMCILLVYNVYSGGLNC